MTVAIVYGGKSGEHEVSLISGAAIARNANKSHNVILIGVTKKGNFFLQDKSEYERICADEKSVLTITEKPENKISVIPGGGKNSFATAKETLNIDVVFSAIHGTYGEDGTLQGLLEMADVPYVGCGVLSSALTMDKDLAKRIWRDAGLPVVPFVCITRNDLSDSNKYDTFVANAISQLGFPLFVKPCSAGSSDGACKASNAKELSFALMEAFEWDDKVLIEKSIDALEVECSVVGNSVTANAANEKETVRVFGPGAIAPTHTFYDYDAKYNDPDGADLQIPAKISEDAAKKIRELAILAYKACDCSGLSRVDFFLDKNNGEIYINELNSLPGFTQISMFPKLCGYEGIGFTELIDLLIEESLAQFQAKRNLRTSR